MSSLTSCDIVVDVDTMVDGDDDSNDGDALFVSLSSIVVTFDGMVVVVAATIFWFLALLMMHRLRCGDTDDGSGITRGIADGNDGRVINDVDIIQVSPVSLTAVRYNPSCVTIMRGFTHWRLRDLRFVTRRITRNGNSSG